MNDLWRLRGAVSAPPSSIARRRAPLIIYCGRVRQSAGQVVVITGLGGLGRFLTVALKFGNKKKKKRDPLHVCYVRAEAASRLRI